MRFSNLLAASVVAPLVVAHGHGGMPQLHGLPRQLRARNPFDSRPAFGPALPRRQTVVNTQPGGTCGPDNGYTSCLSTECCSPEGNCGNGSDYCPAPDCLFEYGPACDANQTPAGASTRDDPRPQLGNVPYGGAGIYTCNTPGEVALTFDDGPYIYTNDILDILSAAGAKATFFVTGNNLGKGEIDTSWVSVIQRMASDGHQIASHTWSHQDLNNITESEAYDQMIKNEMALRNILGKYPTYMRPPYSDCGATCEGIMTTLGYHVIYFDVDTDDYDQDSPLLIQTAKNNFKNGIDSRGAANERLVIAHDIHEQTAHNLTAYMLSYLSSQGLTPVTVGQCLGDDAANWYRASSPAVASSSSMSSSMSSTSSAPSATPTVSSLDGTCGNVNGGNNKGYTCTGFKEGNGLLAECCSPFGYCGNSDVYCGSGCQAGFGKCGIASSSTSAAPAATPTATSPNGACAGTSGFACNGFVNHDGVLSECCSSWGYCGNTTQYCGTGCQAGYGKCLGGSSSMSSMSSTAPAASSTPVSMSSMSSSSVRATSSSASLSSASSMSAQASSSASTRASSSGSASVRTSSASSSSVHTSASGSSSSGASGSPTVTASSNSVKATSAASSYPASSVKATSSAMSSYPVSSMKPSSYPASSMKPSSYPASSMQANSYPASSAKPTAASYSAAQPSSVKAYTAASPSPSAPLSKNGKCGNQYGSGQTCAGYKNSMGVAVECCCADSGTCSNDAWACGQGCDKNFGNCWGYY